ncbi:hypothetical protein Ciccas_009107 [Cichlidogyrus casuarinus]|uniref:Uncharacterized protein n=1 Tax=Cichlidogyrus casuarinus TaxID=1844966 RepID=A0ABD2PYZ1_9PLAT
MQNLTFLESLLQENLQTDYIKRCLDKLGFELAKGSVMKKDVIYRFNHLFSAWLNEDKLDTNVSLYSTIEIACAFDL